MHLNHGYAKRRRGRAFFLAAAVLGAALFAAQGADARNLKTSIPADPGQIDPITYSELVAGDILGNMYEGFTAITPEGKIRPALAESWEALPDNMGFTFKLRKGVKTHLGNEFTAEDVKATFEALLIPENKGGLNAGYLDVVEGAKDMKDGKTKTLAGVVVVDPYTVTIKFSKPDVLFPVYPFYFMDKTAMAGGAEGFLKASAGTGPFKFVKWDRGQNVTLAKHADYWGAKASVDGVEFLIVPNADTAVSMFEAKELDVVYVEQAALRRVMKTPELKELSLQAPAAQIRYLGMNQNLYAPFKDKRVREAICKSLDLDSMITGTLQGLALPLAGQITPGVAGYNASLKPIAFDPDAAKKLLAEAGFPDGKNMPPIKISSTDPNRNEILYFASQLKQVLNMPVEIEVVERGSFIKAMNAGEVPFFPWGWSAGYPDGMYFLSQVWYGPSPYNRARWKNAEFDALIEEAQKTADNEKRYALYNKAEEILVGEYGTCPTTVRIQVALQQPNVKGLALTAFRFLPFNSVSIQ